METERERDEHFTPCDERNKKVTFGYTLHHLNIHKAFMRGTSKFYLQPA